MSPIPLPALDVRPPQPGQNPLEDVMRMFQIKSLQNQGALQGAQLQSEQMRNQAQSLELQDDEKWRQAMSDPQWDGSPDQLLKTEFRSGVAVSVTVLYVTVRAGFWTGMVQPAVDPVAQASPAPVMDPPPVPVACAVRTKELGSNLAPIVFEEVIDAGQV